jgi:cytochrome c peroxidase
VRTVVAILSLILLTAALTSCGRPKPVETAAAKSTGVPIEIRAPLGLPPVITPADNPPTAETIALGRRLYYDPVLSADKTVSCASCHNPKLGFSDGAPHSTGVGGKKGNRNAPTVWNSAYSTVQFWDGRAPSLEAQASGPMQNPIEMAHTLTGVEAVLNADPSYRASFESAFGPGPVTMDKVTKAIASFERTVISGNSPFDRFMYASDKKALSPSAQRGMDIFKDPKKGNCAVCHTIGDKYALLTDNEFHNIGVGVNGRGELTDLGRYSVTKLETDRGAFKTPTLRNIAQSAPYMHDGSLKTLKEVVDFYVGGGSSNPFRDKEIRSLEHLSKQDRADLLAFLESLTGEMPSDVGPPEEEDK